jgi:hypothetical protein
MTRKIDAKPAQAMTEVVALFDGTSLSFALPRGATLEELALRLARLGKRHGSPRAVSLCLKAA